MSPHARMMLPKGIKNRRRKARQITPDPKRRMSIASILNDSSDSADDSAAQPEITISVTSRKRSPLIQAETEAEAGAEQRPTPNTAEPAKKRRRVAPKPKAKPVVPLTKPPTQPITIYVVGMGDGGELGMGPNKTDKSRPSLNRFLDPSDAASRFRIVQLSCGGMHVVALTDDNQIVTWGTNDNYALGRDTSWDGVLRDIDDEEDSEQGLELNPHESTPTAIPEACFPKGTQFTQVAAGDSCSFALTADGLVYGWGTFRDSSGNARFGYNNEGKLIEYQTTPRLVPGLKEIVQIVCGADHALALDKSGTVWGWGSHEQNQLGRRLFGRHTESLIPRRVEVCRGRATYIASGEFHAFAIDRRDNVWAWGLNSFGEAGQAKDAGSDNCLLPYPIKIAGLSGQRITVLDGGAHHSAAVSAAGDVYVWGRMDGGQLGIDFDDEQLADETLIRRDDRGDARICLRPTKVPRLGDGAATVTHVACGSDHTVFVARSGRAFSTGIGSCLQLGLGTDQDARVAEPVKMEKGHEGVVLTWAGAGGQFSVFGSAASKE